MTGKAHTNKFKWGKLDSKDWKHLLGGAVVFYAIYYIAYLMVRFVDFDFALDNKWVAMMGTFCFAAIWEYSQQWRNHKIQMDLKDIMVTCLVGIISVILL